MAIGRGGLTLAAALSMPDHEPHADRVARLIASIPIDRLPPDLQVWALLAIVAVQVIGMGLARIAAAIRARGSARA